MNLAHLVWDSSLRQTVIICLKILRPGLPITRHTTKLINKKKRKKLLAFFFLPLSKDRPRLSFVCVWGRKRQQERKRSKWNNPPLMSNQIGTFLPFHTTSPVLFGRLKERQSSLAAGAVESKMQRCKLSPIQWLNSHMSQDVNVMRILALILNKVRHFYYSFLNSLCFSWNGGDLKGAHLSCSGVSPLGASTSPHR